MSADELTLPADDPFVRGIAPGVRSVVDAAPALTLDEVRSRSALGDLPGPRSSVAWRVAAAAAVLVVLIGAGLTWRHRNATRPVASELLPVPAQLTGPVPAENTAASTGEPSRTFAADWNVVRTGGDDRQLVVFFGGGGCGAWRADVAESPDAVSIEIFEVFPTDEGVGCPAIRIEQAIGIELVDPIGDRRLEGSRAIDGMAWTEPLLVDGSELATLSWPPGSTRAATEAMNGHPVGGDFVWTQQFGDSSDPSHTSLPVELEQWRGGPNDASAFGNACQAVVGIAMSPVDVGGTPATLGRCPDGSLAVVWVTGTDRFTLHVDAGTPGIDETTIVDLAETVRFV